MPVCPFCKAGYSPRAIQVADERLLAEDINGEIWESVEPFQCYCGAWWYEGMEDVEDD
jgi:hypothetical protein